MEPGTSHLRVRLAISHSRSVKGPGMDSAVCFHGSEVRAATNCATAETANSWKTNIWTQGTVSAAWVTMSAILFTVALTSHGTTDICTPAIPNRRGIRLSYWPPFTSVQILSY